MDDSTVALKLVARETEDAGAILAAPPTWIDLLPIAAYACDASGSLRWFNNRAVQLWGRTPRIGDSSERFCGSYRLYDLAGRLIRHDECPMAQALRTGEPIEAHAGIERPDGSRVLVAAHINPLKDAAGNIVGAINCLHDVTAEKEEQHSLRLAERRFRELLDMLPAAVYTTDASGRITYYNEAAAALAGRHPKLGEDEWCVTWRLYHPDGTPMPHSACPMAVALNEDRPVRGLEAVAERPDGTRVPFIPYPTPLHDAAGNLVGAVNMLVDISQRKEAETQQRMLLSELNHRIKNNMQMLHALLNAARRETSSPEARAALTDAIQRIGAMAAAQTVLYQANNAEGYDAREFLGAVCGLFEKASGNRVAIRCDLAEGTLSNDTVAPLALILNELLTNAVKHGTSGKATGHVRVSLLRDGGDFVLRVEDDGPGFTLGTAVRRSSGLGLVMGLTGQIGGKFSVECTPGACCTVRFPGGGRVA
jgi:PAS domain S-box-containing protein